MTATRFLRFPALADAKAYKAAADAWHLANMGGAFCAAWYPRIDVLVDEANAPIPDSGDYVVPLLGAPYVEDEPVETAGLRVGIPVIDKVYWPEDFE